MLTNYIVYNLHFKIFCIFTIFSVQLRYLRIAFFIFNANKLAVITHSAMNTYSVLWHLVHKTIIIHPLRILNKSHRTSKTIREEDVMGVGTTERRTPVSHVNTILLYFPRRSSGHDVIRIEARLLSMRTLSTWPRRVRHSSSDSLDRRMVDANSSAPHPRAS